MQFKPFFLLLLAVFLAFPVSGQTGGRAKTDPIKIGDTAPDFELRDETGNTIRLSDVKGTTVLVFYRAYWCPYCVRQLAELRSLKGPGDKFKLFGISKDPSTRAIETRVKIAKDGKGDVNFPLLSDPDGKTINAFGIYDPTYAAKEVDGIARAAVFVLDKNRKVVWARIETDYKTRPTNRDIRAEALKVKR